MFVAFFEKFLGSAVFCKKHLLSLFLYPVYVKHTLRSLFDFHFLYRDCMIVMD